MRFRYRHIPFFPRILRPIHECSRITADAVVIHHLAAPHPLDCLHLDAGVVRVTENHQISGMVPQPPLHIQRLRPGQFAAHESVVQVDGDFVRADPLLRAVKRQNQPAIVSQAQTMVGRESSSILDTRYNLRKYMALIMLVNGPLVIPFYERKAFMGNGLHNVKESFTLRTRQISQRSPHWQSR